MWNAARMNLVLAVVIGRWDHVGNLSWKLRGLHPGAAASALQHRHTLFCCLSLHRGSCPQWKKETALNISLTRETGMTIAERGTGLAAAGRGGSPPAAAPPRQRPATAPRRPPGPAGLRAPPRPRRHPPHRRPALRPAEVPLPKTSAAACHGLPRQVAERAPGFEPRARAALARSRLPVAGVRSRSALGSSHFLAISYGLRFIRVRSPFRNSRESAAHA